METLIVLGLMVVISVIGWIIVNYQVKKELEKPDYTYMVRPKKQQ